GSVERDLLRSARRDLGARDVHGAPRAALVPGGVPAGVDQHEGVARGERGRDIRRVGLIAELGGEMLDRRGVDHRSCSRQGPDATERSTTATTPRPPPGGDLPPTPTLRSPCPNRPPPTTPPPRVVAASST